MRRPTVAVLVVAALVGVTPLVAGGCSSLGAGSGAGATASGVVTDVIDGDTIDVADVGRVRLIGIDTPEVGECGYEPATERLVDLVLGEQVDLVPGGTDDVDRYDRLLRYVDLDGLDVGLVLVEEGLAVSRYDSRDGYGEHDREQEYVGTDTASSRYAGCPAG